MHRAAVLLALSAAACGSESERTTLKEDVGGGAPGGAGVASVTSSSSASGVGGVGASGSTSGSGASGGAGGEGPWDGPVESLVELDLGQLEVDQTHDFPVPDRTLGLTLIAGAADPGELLGLRRLRPPDGGSVIYDFAMTNHDTAVFVGVGWIGGANPQSDASNAVPVQEGKWTFSLGDDDEAMASASVRVWVRRTEDGAFHGGVMDVNVFIAPGVADSGYVDQVLAALFAGGYAGLGPGQVELYPLDAAFSVVDDRAELRQMFQTTSVAATAPALNLFVVADFGNSEFGGAIGVAGGIPGAAPEPGTNRSGVAYQPSGNAGYDATVLAHEIGHLGGLFHTTEVELEETDPLSDTAACAYATIQSDPGSCPDGGNVMFPIAYGGTVFSAAQVRVLQGSALYRGILQEGGAPAPPLSVASRAAPLVPAAPWPTLAAVDDAPRRPPRDALERVLAGTWCAHASSDHLGLAIAVAARARGGPIAPLRSVATDAGAAALVRGRALAAWWRAASSIGGAELSRATAYAAAIAKDDAAPRRLRAAAARALAASGSADGRGALVRVRASADPILRALAAAP